MGPFIVALVFTAAAVGLAIFAGRIQQKARLKLAAAAPNARDRHDLASDVVAMAWVKLIGRLGVAAGIIWLIALSITIVPTRNIGVSIAFGKPTGTLGNGFHIIAPWEAVETYDASIQTLDMADHGGDDGKPAMNVRIANAATAVMHVTVQWQIDPNADIKQLHLDWRSFEAIQDKVVKPRLAASLNTVFESYDPLIALKQAGGKPTSLGDMEPKVREHLQASMPSGIIVRSLMLPFVKYPDQVQNALNDFQKELAATQVAIQQQQTAAAQKAAIEILASAKMTPEAFQQQCLVVTERLAQQGKALPAAWSCTLAPTSVVPVR